MFLDKVRPIQLKTYLALFMLLLPCQSHRAFSSVPIQEGSYLIQERPLLESDSTNRWNKLDELIWGLLHRVRQNPEGVRDFFRGQGAEIPSDYLDRGKLVDPILLLLAGIACDRLTAEGDKTDKEQAERAKAIYQTGISFVHRLSWAKEDKEKLTNMLERLRDDALHYGFTVVFDESLAGEPGANSRRLYNPDELVGGARFVDPWAADWVRVSRLGADVGTSSSVDVEIITGTYKDEEDHYRLSAEGARNAVEISEIALTKLGVHSKYDSFPVKIELLQSKGGAPALTNHHRHFGYAIRLVLYRNSEQGEQNAIDLRDNLSSPDHFNLNADMRPNFFYRQLRSGKYVVYLGPYSTRREAENALQTHGIANHPYGSEHPFTGAYITDVWYSEHNESSKPQFGFSMIESD